MKPFKRAAIAGLLACISFGVITFNSLQHLGVQAVSPPSLAPKVIVISLDSGNAQTVEDLLTKGVLPKDGGLAQLKQAGATAKRNITITPSVTAPGHIAIATGSTAARNNITANTFHLIVSNIRSTVSGFAAPIGGYQPSNPPVPSSSPTAEPMWVKLRASGKKVATATWPGSDGVTVREPTSQAIVQSADSRTVDYTVPFGAFAGIGARGFTLAQSDFSNAPQTTLDQLTAAGKASFSPVLQKTTSLETFTVQGVNYDIQVAAIDTSNDTVTNYDTLVFWDKTQGIKPGPFSLPSTGPAYVKASEDRSKLFYLEGSSGKAGTAFYVTKLDPQLATIRLARYSANNIPRTGTSAVLANVDDVNTNVGFWAPQPDFRIPERISPGFTNFPDPELEAVYEDQVESFVNYQTNLGLRAIKQNPGADLVMIYIEQPDGSGHQFTLTDPRQATDFTNPNTIGAGQDQQKIRRYQTYRDAAYRVADQAVKRIIDAVGTTDGVPNSNIFVVSDHGMAPFHTAVNLANLLANSGIDNTKVRAYSTGPAANIYINLQGRESGGTVPPSEYSALQQQIVDALTSFTDGNPVYKQTKFGKNPIFDLVEKRPGNDGLGQNALIGQDSGDVFAIMKPGYNFDGTQNPVVLRQGDSASATPVLSVPNFYGAHGYDSRLPEMSAVFLAAGPDIRPGITLPVVRNIDVAPTVFSILGVEPGPMVEGRAIQRSLRK
jgi:predicted AlkP superfamily pyrophosphatase or phosphodiesterase